MQQQYFKMDRDPWKNPTNEQIKEYADYLSDIFPQELEIDCKWSSFYYRKIFQEFLHKKNMRMITRSRFEFFYALIIKYFKSIDHPKFSLLTLAIASNDQKKHPPSTGVIVFDPQTRKFLVVKDIRTGCLGFVKSGMQYRESIPQSAKRVLMQEVNLKLKLNQKKKFSFFFKKQKRYCNLYICQMRERYIEINQKEVCGYEWLNLQDLQSLRKTKKFNHLTLEGYRHFVQFEENQKKQQQKILQEQRDLKKNFEKKKNKTYIEKKEQCGEEKSMKKKKYLSKTYIQKEAKGEEKDMKKNEQTEKKKKVQIEKKEEKPVQVSEDQEELFFNPQHYPQFTKTLKNFSRWRGTHKKIDKTSSSISSTSCLGIKVNENRPSQSKSFVD